MDLFEKNILESNRQLGRNGLTALNLRKLSGRKPDGVVILGMGGSNLPGEILRSVRRELGLGNLPVILWKDYDLPDIGEWRLKRPLYVFISFSGNTEEPVSGLAEFLKNKKRVPAVVAHGGKMESLARRHGLPLVLFPAADLNPRQYTGRMLYGLLEVLRASGLALRGESDLTGLSPARSRNAGRALARKLRNKVVVIYTDEGNRHLGYIWKIKLNETSKNLAFANILPEMNHNEIVGFERKGSAVAALFIHGRTGGRLEKRIKITQKILAEKGATVVPLVPAGRTALERTWRSIMLAGWTSFYLAKLNPVEPAPVRIVERLKKLMAA